MSGGTSTLHREREFAIPSADVSTCCGCMPRTLTSLLPTCVRVFFLPAHTSCSRFHAGQHTGGVSPNTFFVFLLLSHVLRRALSQLISTGKAVTHTQCLIIGTRSRS